MNKYRLSKIVRELIKQGKVFRCPYCNRLFGSAEWLEQHRDGGCKSDNRKEKQ